MLAKELTDETIADFINTESKHRPVLMCFYSTEEDTHYQFDRMLNELTCIQDEATIGKIDAWKHPQSTKHYHVGWFPTLILFEDSEIKGYCVGEAHATDVMS